MSAASRERERQRFTAVIDNPLGIVRALARAKAEQRMEQQKSETRRFLRQKEARV